MFRVVEFVATFLFALTLLLLGVVLLLRLNLVWRERRRRKFLSIWQPILTTSIDLAFADVPHLPRRNLPDFLHLWNQLQESVLDRSKERLNQIARALRIDRAALQMLSHRSLRDRLLATMTLGELRERKARDALVQIMHEEGASLSVNAARSVVLIDPQRAVPLLLPMMIKRSDWPAARVATILQTAGADIISNQIAEAALAACAEDATDETNGEVSHQRARLIRYLELAYNVSALPVARKIAQSSRDPEVLAACLRLLKSSEDLPIVRRCLVHADWRVRVQAASALGRIGRADDASRLIPLLSDEQWWVRYRAAQALARLPTVDQRALRKVQADQQNPFARDMLAQVMAEVELQ